MKLDYLLEVEFSDGSSWKQDPSDVSKVDATKSQYFDLLQLNKNIVKASLVSRNWLFKKRLTVDLVDGHFQFNKNWLQVDQNPLPLMKRELVFFREHQHDANFTVNAKTGVTSKITETAHRIKYFIGWKATLNSKDYQQIIGIK